jgi:peptidoglycan/xylan/chitin deacetylase (PgdA/CDA1 family)
MPRWRFRFDTRALFAILMLAAGVLLPLLSSFSAPHRVQVAAAALPTAHIVLPTAHIVLPTRRVPQIGGPAPTGDQAPAVASEPTAPPIATTAAAPITAAPASTPESSSIAPIGGVLRPVATLFPTLAVPAGGASAPPSQPVVAPAAEGAGPPPPILMYHYIRTVDQASDPLGYELSVAPELFEAHMAWLHEQGYTAMRMDAAARCLRGETVCPARAVALTFDDGYADAFTTAWPVLQRYGFTATFYIVSGLVGQQGYMSWEQLAMLRDSGMEIGAHTVDHPDLTSLDPATAEYQIAQPKADLEGQLGISVVSFCYPTGLYNWGIEEQTRAAGYLSATTTRWDSDYSDIMALPRRRVGGGTAVEGFAAIVQGW